MRDSAIWTGVGAGGGPTGQLANRALGFFHGVRRGLTVGQWPGLLLAKWGRRSGQLGAMKWPLSHEQTPAHPARPAGGAGPASLSRMMSFCQIFCDSPVARFSK